MANFKRRRFRRKSSERSMKPSRTGGLVRPDKTGSEADYLKSLVESHAKVTVVLKNGERLQGRIRYYDRDCFSVGPSGGGPKVFLRKGSVSYISEE